MGTAAAPYGVTTPVVTNFLFQAVGVPQSNPSLSQSLQLNNPTSGLQVLTLDAMPRAVHSSKADVTRNPLEFGSDATDNARPLPDELTIDGFVSGVPIDEPGQQFAYGTNPAVKSAFDTLRNLKDTATIIDVVTGLHEYPNMLIESLEFVEEAQTGDSLRFTAHLVAVRIISSQTINPPAAVKHAQGKASQGNKVTAPATPTQQTSVAHDIVEFFSGGGAQSQALNTSGG